MKTSMWIHLQEEKIPIDGIFYETQSFLEKEELHEAPEPTLDKKEEVGACYRRKVSWGK